MRSALLVSVLFASACVDPGKPVYADCASPSGGITNADYAFLAGNFSCDTNPIDVPFDLDSGSFVSATSGGASLTSADVIDDFEFAAAEWSSTGADLVVTVGDTNLIGGVYDSVDGEYHVFMEDGFDPADDGVDTFAVTRQWSFFGETMECDIKFFSQFRGSGGGGPTEIAYVDAGSSVGVGDIDLTYIFVHELGHCVGIADQEAESTEGDIMFNAYAPGTAYTGLSTDEIEAAIFLYGEA